MAVGTWQCDNCKQPLIGTETICPKCGTALIPALTASPSVEIRRYPSVMAFQADAAVMANAGWRVVAQSSGSKMSGSGSACVALGVIAAIAGVLVWLPLVLVGILLMVIGAVSRATTYTVTYVPA